LVEHLRLERSGSYSPLFQTMFVLQNVLTGNWAGSNLGMNLLGVDTGLTRVDFYMSLAETSEGGLEGMVEYNTDLFFPATIEGMIQSYANLLEQIGENPDRRVAAIPLIPPNESLKISCDFSV
jgi:non-ribosomal peptide synthetase component F